MHILLVGNARSIHLQRWAGALAERGCSVTIVATTEPGSAEDAPLLSRVRLVSCLLYDAQMPSVERWHSSFRKWREFRGVIKEYAPDIVHVHWLPISSTVFAFTALKNLVITVWGSDVVHYGPMPEPKRGIFYKRYALGQSAAVTASSLFLAQECEKYLHPRRRVWVVPFGVDTSLFTPPSSRVQSNEIVIGFVKHLEDKYGVDDLIAAFEQVIDRCPHVRLILAGKGPLEQHLKELVRSKELVSFVDFVGEVSHDAVPNLLSRCDIFVMPSLREALGVAAIEALSMEIPVVATRVGGIIEVVQDGDTGLLVPPNSPSALAEALIRLVEDGDLRQRMGSKGRRDVMERYEWQRCVDKMIEMYRTVMAQRRSFSAQSGLAMC